VGATVTERTGPPGYPRTAAVGPAWTRQQLLDKLAEHGLRPERVIRVKVGEGDVDPEHARVRAERARRRTWLIAVPLIAATAVWSWHAIGHGQGLRISSGALLVQVLVQQLPMWAIRPRISSAVPEGSQAESFVRALLHSTNVLRAVAGRWLVVSSPSDTSVVMQEERWDVTGAHQELEMRWDKNVGRVVSVAEVGRRPLRRIQLRFADGSMVVIQLPRAARECILR